MKLRNNKNLKNFGVDYKMLLNEWPALPKELLQRRLNNVWGIIEELICIVKPECIKDWMNEPNPKFYGLSPFQLLVFGDFDLLWEMIVELDGR